MVLLIIIIFVASLDYSFGDVISVEVTKVPLRFSGYVHDITTGPSGNLIATDHHAVWNVNIEVNPPIKYNIAGSVLSGYAEGKGGNARFYHPAAVMLMNDTYIIVADERNHCLRLIDLLTNSTFPYAGTCEISGYTDGYRLNATFNNPKGMIRLMSKIFISDRSNQAIRMLESDFLTTLYKHSGDSLFNNPRYLTAWNNGSIYATVDHGVIRIDTNLVNRTASIELISAFPVNGYVDGNLTSALYNMPVGISHLDKDTLVVTSGKRLQIMDLKDKIVTSICSKGKDLLQGCGNASFFISTQSVHVYKNKLIIGDVGGISTIPNNFVRKPQREVELNVGILIPNYAYLSLLSIILVIMVIVLSAICYKRRRYDSETVAELGDGRYVNIMFIHEPQSTQDTLLQHNSQSEYFPNDHVLKSENQSSEYEVVDGETTGRSNYESVRRQEEHPYERLTHSSDDIDEASDLSIECPSYENIPNRNQNN